MSHIKQIQEIREVPAASNELSTVGKKTGESTGGKQPGVKPS